MDRETLDTVLAAHHTWLETGGQTGQRAELGWASLEGMDLQGINLSRANLQMANLRHVNFTGAQLEGAQLTGADLEAAELVEAMNLYRAGRSDSSLRAFVGDLRRRLRGIRGSGSIADIGTVAPNVVC